MLDAPSDDGRPDPRLAAALTAHDGTPAARAEVLAALAGARVFLALEPRAAPVAGRSGTEVSLVQLAGPDGRRALPAFIDGQALSGWRPGARPLPVAGRQACATALDGDCDVLLLEPAGAAVAVGAGELAELAEGRVPVPGSSISIRRTALQGRAPEAPAGAELLAVLGAALADEPVSAARWLAGPDGPVLGIVLADPLPAAALAALAERVARRLGAALPSEGLDLAVVGAQGPGQPVPLVRIP